MGHLSLIRMGHPSFQKAWCGLVSGQMVPPLSRSAFASCCFYYCWIPFAAHCAMRTARRPCCVSSSCLLIQHHHSPGTSSVASEGTRVPAGVGASQRPPSAPSSLVHYLARFPPHPISFLPPSSQWTSVLPCLTSLLWRRQMTRESLSSLLIALGNAPLLRWNPESLSHPGGRCHFVPFFGEAHRRTPVSANQPGSFLPSRWSIRTSSYAFPSQHLIRHLPR
eukprot:scaffold368_cov258-Pinguiococcus_pyrenoidosus.AAC.82